MNRYVFFNFGRTLRTSWRIYVTAVFMSAVAYAITGAFFLLHRNVTLTTRFWVRSVPVTLILDRGVAPERVREIELAARAEGAASIHLVTPDEGRKRLESSLRDASLFEGFDSNPLPPMMELGFPIPPPASKIAYMRSWAGVADVDDAGRWSERFRSLLAGLDRIGALLALVLLSAAFTVASLSARLVAANHADEIEIQHLVGAPPGFVRAPYMLAGGFQGLVAGLGALGAIYALYRAAAAIPLASWPIPIQPPVFFSLEETGALLGAAVFIGVAGSFVGVRKRVR